MAIWLRYNTASQEVCLGPFVDATDGKTAETGLTIANTDIVLWKMGATSTGAKNSGGGTHMAGGLYSAVFDATDTGTLGGLVATINVAGALPVRHEFQVLPAMIYDSLIAGTDLLDIEPSSVWDLDATAHQTAGTFGKAIGDPLAATNSLIQRTPDAVAGATGGLFIAGTNAATSVTTALTANITGNLSGSVGSVTGLTASNLDTTVSSRLAPTVAARTLDVSATGEAGIDWANVGTPGSTVALSATTLGTVTTVTNLTEDVQSAVWDVDATGHQTQGTFGQAVGDPGATAKSIWSVANALPDSGALTTLQADTDNIQTRLPAALESGRMAAALDATGVDAILDDPIEGSMTLRQAMRIILAACANKLSGAETTTVTFRDLADTKARITATVDANGNRLAVTLDET